MSKRKTLLRLPGETGADVVARLPGSVELGRAEVFEALGGYCGIPRDQLVIGWDLDNGRVVLAQVCNSEERTNVERIIS